jgi:hypothetical protein
MYAAKAAGKNRVEVFHPDMRNTTSSARRWSRTSSAPSTWARSSCRTSRSST